MVTSDGRTTQANMVDPAAAGDGDDVPIEALDGLNLVETFSSGSTHDELPLSHLEGCPKGDEPLLQKRLAGTNIDRDVNVEDEPARLAALCSSLHNLPRPIKLIRPQVLWQLGRFPCYHEEFEHEPLDEFSFQKCVAVSHRWTDEDNTRSDLDVQWLRRNYHIIDFDGVDDPLFFYDLTALPQEIGGRMRDREDKITFKAGLEFLDHLFSQRTLVIPTQGYLFRYWCYVEFFLCEYRRSRICGVPFMDSLPGDLALIDEIGKKIRQRALVPTATFPPHELMVKCLGILSLGTGTKQGLAMGLLHVNQLDKPSCIALLNELQIMRRDVVDLVRARIRQCSLSRDGDKAILESVLARYLDNTFLSLHQGSLGGWDGETAMADAMNYLDELAVHRGEEESD